jgi:UDP-N-acetylglucosamine transferase subunit ALG13
MIKICFTANSGGHLNQLMQIQRAVDGCVCFYVTDRNAFSEELARHKRVYFVEKFIIKECIKKLQFIKPFWNLWQSFLILQREQPDWIITTGAGTAFGSCLAGRLLKKKVLFIESIARTQQPSIFGKIISPIADVVFVQWKNILKHYRRAIYSGIIFDLRHVPAVNQKTNMIFVTTGTYKLQFDRLLVELDRLKDIGQIKAKVVAQVGHSNYRPQHFKAFSFAPQDKIHELIKASEIVICHGGSGSIMDSLSRGKKVIAVPRMKDFREFFDDHQFDIVRELERMGLILAVYDIRHLGATIKRAKNFKPRLQNMGSRFEEQFKRIIQVDRPWLG